MKVLEKSKSLSDPHCDQVIHREREGEREEGRRGASNFVGDEAASDRRVDAAVFNVAPQEGEEEEMADLNSPRRQGCSPEKDKYCKSSCKCNE